MKVTITFDIYNCANCPFRDYYREQGFAGYMCDHPKTKEIIECSDYEVPEDCPFLKERKENKK